MYGCGNVCVLPCVLHVRLGCDVQRWLACGFLKLTRSCRGIGIYDAIMCAALRGIGVHDAMMCGNV